jgi:hypothetical protein
VTAIDAVLDSGFERLAIAELREVVVAIERCGRRLGAAFVEALAVAERCGVPALDGAVSMKNWVSFATGMAGTTARQWVELGSTLSRLPLFAAALRDGEITIDHVRSMTALAANPRIRHLLPDAEEALVDYARQSRHVDFDIVARRWHALADTDGPTPTERARARREVRLRPDADGTWLLSGRLAPVQGAELHQVLAELAGVERRGDWDRSRQRHGTDGSGCSGAGCACGMRTPGQHLADALHRAVVGGAACTSSTNGTTPTPTASGPRVPSVNLVISEEAYERGLLQLLGGVPEAPTVDEARAWRCGLTDGTPLPPPDVVAASLMGHIRRVVLGAAGIVIDLGARRTLTGVARDVAWLQHSHCTGVGCERPASTCEADHTVPHTLGGPTNAANTTPRCGPDNRIKNRGITTTRGPDGTIHHHRPDGSIIRPPTGSP